MHIYHFANHEKTVLTRLSKDHATRRDEVSTWMHEGVLVDLYEVVTQGLLYGGDGYSIKALERAYRDNGRATEVTNGLDSVLCFEQWLTSGQPANPDSSPLLASIRSYNRDDCESTAQLTHWLRGQQAQARFEALQREVHGLSLLQPPLGYPPERSAVPLSDPQLAPSLPPLVTDPIRVVVSGYGPFDDVTDNPSQHLASALAERGLDGAVVEAVALPVSYEAVDLWIDELRRTPPAIVLSLGYTRHQAQVEHLPVNHIGRLGKVEPAETGRHAVGPIDTEAPPELPSILPIGPIERALAQVAPRSIATWASLGSTYQPDRSGYLCNYLNFRLTHAFLPDALQAETQASVPVLRGFVHVTATTTLDEVHALAQALVDEHYQLAQATTPTFAQTCS
jgi:pyrrolidone-carboxylate peptidase